MDQKTLILSIIVPVYNVEKYLRDCLDSLLMQDLSEDEYEIICVDDGSKDSSPAILDEYAENHSNIRVIHKQNGGVSSARNRGLEEARGEYVEFVDADDYLRVGTLGQIFELIRVQRPDAVQIQATPISEGLHFNPDSSNIVMTHKYISMEGEASSIFFTCTELILKRALIEQHNLQFPENLAYGEDTVFGFAVWQVIEGIERFSSPVYYYRMRKDSAMHQYTKAAMNRRLHDSIFRAHLFNEFLQNADKNSQRYKTVFTCQRICSLNILNVLLLSDSSISETLNEMKKCHMPHPHIHSWKAVFAKEYSIKERLGILKNIILMKNMKIYKFWAYFFRIIPIYRWTYCLFRKIFV